MNDDYSENDHNENTDNYMDYLDNFADKPYRPKELPNKKSNDSRNRNKRKRNSEKGYSESKKQPNHRGIYLEFNHGENIGGKKTDNTKRRRQRRIKRIKRRIIRALRRPATAAVIVSVALIIVIASVTSVCISNSARNTAAETNAAESKPVTSYRINGVPVITQTELKAGCETYACVMLLQYLGFDIDEFEFAENYLITMPVSYDEEGRIYGPDMNSAYAGDIYTGYGVNAPGMAKFMNTFFKDKGSKLTATPLKGRTLESLCNEYVVNNIPVMVWATTDMAEPFVKASWIVNYVDDNTDTKLGDIMEWQFHEHCMVLIGFDEENYYFCDSVAGTVSFFGKEITEKRYSQLGMQAIVAK